MADEVSTLITAKQLIRARESLGLERGEVANKLGIDEGNLTSWEKGDSNPPLETLWDLAELYQRSTDYFLRQTPALPEHLSFRLERRKVIRDLPPEVRKTIVRFEELCRAEAELEQAIGKSQETLIERVENIYSPQELANKERGRLGIGERPIKDLREILVGQGIRVFMLPIPNIPASELSGLSWWHNAYGPCILVNSRNNPGRRTFTLAHEYGHLLRAEPPTVCAFMLDIPEERFAHQFAAIFLMPANDLRKSFVELVEAPGTVPSDPDLGRIASRYGVSLEAAGRRLEDLGLIPQGTTNSRIAEWEKKRPTYYSGKRGPVWRRQLGEGFVTMALEAHSKGLISLSKLAKYFGQDVRKTREVVVEESGASPKRD